MNLSNVSTNVSADIQLRPTPQVGNNNYEQKEPLETERKVSKEQVIDTVDKMNEFIKLSNTNLKFVLHDELMEYYVTVVDSMTDEVIREIPPKKMLDMYSAMIRYMGILVDEKV